MILFDLFTCLFWFNPFSWLLKREIQSIHEYQADKLVLDIGINLKQYQLLLIRKSVGDQKFAMANNLRQRSLHKRIIMMNKSKTKNNQKLRYAISIPALLMAIVVLSSPKLNAQEPETVKITIEGVEVSETLDISPGNKDVGVPIYFLDGERIDHSKITDIPAKDIQSVEVLKGKSATELYGEEAKNGAVIIKTKSESNQPKVNSEAVVSFENLENAPLIIIDGKKMPLGSIINSLVEPKDIKDISVIKRKSAVDLYGVDAEHGVVIINTLEAEKE